MSCKVEWLPESLSDMARLFKFLETKNVIAAERAMKAVSDRVIILKDSPKISRLMPDETGRGELIVPFGSGAYIIRYVIEIESKVVIVRVWHSLEDR